VIVFVVPANAGTHNHRRQCCAINQRRVPTETSRRMGPRFRGDDNGAIAADVPGSATVHLGRAKLSRHHSHARRGRCHGTPPLSEIGIWICRGRGCAGRERTGSTVCAASARRGRTAAAVERGCTSRCHYRGRGGTSETGRGALAPSLGLAPPPLAPSLAPPSSLGLAPPSLGLASPSLGLAPSSLAPPLLAPSLLVR
jgi:hypothetical protein